MNKTLAPFVLLVLAGAPAVAHAGDAAATAAEAVSPFASEVMLMRERAASRWHASVPKASVCTAAIKAARDAGLADSARLFSTSFYSLEEVHFDDQQQAYLTLGEASALCTEYAAWLPMVPAAGILEETQQSVTIWSTMVDAEEAGRDAGAGLAKRGQECVKAVDDAIAAGADPDRKTKIIDVEMTLTEGKEQVCKALIAFGKKFGAEVAAVADSREAAIRAKYTKHGVKGEKLKLFVEYDDVYWRGKGCEVIDDVKKLAKAKKLYHWLEQSDGSILIRKYEFKGKKVKVTDKAYWTQAQAYRGCK